MTIPVPAGLCGSCAHGRLVQSRRGSGFLLCGLSRRDPRYPRYPRLPLLACDGYTAGAAPGLTGPTPPKSEDGATDD